MKNLVRTQQLSATLFLFFHFSWGSFWQIEKLCTLSSKVKKDLGVVHFGAERAEASGAGELFVHSCCRSFEEESNPAEEEEACQFEPV